MTAGYDKAIAAHERLDRLVELFDDLAYALLVNADTIGISISTLENIRNDLDKLKR